MPLPDNAEEIARKIKSNLTIERRLQIIEHIRAGDKFAAEDRAPEERKDATLKMVIKNGGDEGNFVANLMMKDPSLSDEKELAE